MRFLLRLQLQDTEVDGYTRDTCSPDNSGTPCFDLDGHGCVRSARGETVLGWLSMVPAKGKQVHAEMERLLVRLLLPQPKHAVPGRARVRRSPEGHVWIALRHLVHQSRRGRAILGGLPLYLLPQLRSKQAALGRFKCTSCETHDLGKPCWTDSMCISC